MSNNPYTGSSFDDFLKEEGIYEECTATALKRVLAWQVKQEMQRQKIPKSASAQMKTRLAISSSIEADPL